MKDETKYKILLHKRFFDIGYGMTSYLKTLFVVVGVSVAVNKAPVEYIVVVGLLYGIACYVFGYYFVKHKWFEADIEVGNVYNKFVKEMRKTYK